MPGISSWAQDFRDLASQTAEGFRAAVRDKILPTFENISAEAEVIRKVHLEHLWQRAGRGELAEAPTDPENQSWRYATPEEEADLEAQTYEYAMEAARQTVLNGLVVILWHLFEQHLLVFARQAVFDKDGADTTTHRIGELRSQLKTIYGIDLNAFPSWRKLSELNYVANAVKHGGGKSCDALRQVRPDLFRPSRHGEKLFATLRALQAVLDLEIQTPAHRNRNVEAPLSKHEIRIEPEDLESYFDAVLSFWKELATELEALGQRH